jgi:hypothetical protein
MSGEWGKNIRRAGGRWWGQCFRRGNRLQIGPKPK